jgi:hypothetical protein
MSKNVAVFGLYSSEVTLAEGLDQLQLAGFGSSEVSVLFSRNSGDTLGDALGNQDLVHEKHSKAPEGAATGAGSGAILGGTLGWLAGLGMLAIPGLGPFVAAGPIMAALSGIGVGGTIGGLTGALIGSGMPEYEAKRYEGRLRKGGILLSVHCGTPELEKRAKRILEKTGAQDVASTREAKGDSTAASNRNLEFGEW